ncbi:sensor histidine kinase [Janthinobacterium fluminis]|uniref:Histidine kinase n=1 Tax=Janthinobacterium fluminis TaxID=2987524 RepID=A0ABT5JZ57_9BURK|nr:histidine kinase [Janthinobacterium fluminis]MDC8758017.1 histidine kinase [Janthinobacterium fluminis]
MVSGIRLLLAVAAVLTLFINPQGIGKLTGFTWLVFFGYALNSVTLFLLAQVQHSLLHQRKIYWFDVAWCGLIVYCTGAQNSYFFLFFFFAILAASFHWGFREGARITLASAALLALVVVLAGAAMALSHLLWCVTFLLALGYMIAYWGGLGLQQKRRLALLRDVSRMANPRFGVDQSIASVLEKTRRFFHASSCILIMRDNEPDSWLLRSAVAANAGRAISAGRISAAAAAPLLAFSPEQTVIYARRRVAALAWSGESRVLMRGGARWRPLADGAGAALAELMEARAFISVPLRLRKGDGRVYVMAPRGFNRADALFLKHIAAQAFPVIENIELLDRLASDAAYRERQKIGRDLHDSTIQPYIGLRHGISALRHAAAAAGNPLVGDLDKLIAMATAVIGDMRHFAKSFNSGLVRDEPELLVALRRQIAQVKEFYGIDIGLRAAADLDVSDRLAAEVFQIVTEGVSNIRKHTGARRGSIELGCADGWFRIVIENEADARPARQFLPSSIAGRAAALGGRLHVAQKTDGSTVVQIAIPV